MSRWMVDLNSDLGESFGAYTLGRDEEVLRFVTSANIACGYHAGDHNVMGRTVKAAAEKGVGLGAHPGLPDLLGFGRRRMEVEPKDVYNMTLYQVGALAAFARACKPKTLETVVPAIRRIPTAASNDAITGLRRHQRQPRSSRPTGRAFTGRFSQNASRSSASSWADP